MVRFPSSYKEIPMPVSKYDLANTEQLVAKARDGLIAKLADASVEADGEPAKKAAAAALKLVYDHPEAVTSMLTGQLLNRLLRGAERNQYYLLGHAATQE